MPHTRKERQIYMSLVKKYGAKEGDKRYHMWKNKQKKH